MNSSQPACLLHAVFAVMFLIAAPLVNAQSQPTPTPQAVFGFSSGPDNLLISYSETAEMLADPDPTPRVQVFGDGWVWVHYPEYMRKAGDYELYLNSVELQDLLQNLSAVFDFDPQETAQNRDAIEQTRESQQGIVYFRSEGVVEQFVVQLDSYQATPTDSGRVINLDIAWKNISADAREFPQDNGLQQLAAAKQSIQDLLERDDLVRLDAAPVAN